jgi:uncharacterized protein
MSARLPMFPLGSLLIPYAVLPLHIFEPRYRVLMFDITREGAVPEFGVVLIERGFEVGGQDERFSTGTVARVAQAGELPDGRWVLSAVGTRRVEVEEWLPDDPYPLARVTDRPELPWPGGAADELLGSTEQLVRRTLALTAELGEATPPATITLAAEPEVAAWQLIAVAPLGPFDKQKLLEIDDHGERLRRLAEMAEEERMVLAYRLGGEES